MEAARLTADDFFPLVAKLPPGERARLAYFALGLSRGPRSEVPPGRWDLARLAGTEAQDVSWAEAGLGDWAAELAVEDER